MTFNKTDGWTDRRYQVHYLPRFAVDNKYVNIQNGTKWASLDPFSKTIRHWSQRSTFNLVFCNDLLQYIAFWFLYIWTWPCHCPFYMIHGEANSCPLTLTFINEFFTVPLDSPLLDFYLLYKKMACIPLIKLKWKKKQQKINISGPSTTINNVEPSLATEYTPEVVQEESESFFTPLG